jgi:cellulose synthase/poly-beta-1,6-N-acetylglucosamine synthase-like glycosyltransferase
MIQYVTLIVIFLVLFISFMWLFIYIFNPTRYKNYRLKEHPLVTIVIPMYNEADNILKTLTSLRHLNYPRKALQIFAVDDGSTDKTAEVVKRFIQDHPAMPITYMHQKNQGKACALNKALAKARGVYFSVVDADSEVGPQSLHHIIAMFQHNNGQCGSIISSMKISNLDRFLARVQHIEYMVTIFIRQLMSDIDVLHTTHGVLCVSKTAVLKEIGGFDKNNITEDFEMAVRMRSHGYTVKACKQSVVTTRAPTTLRQFWRQRIRWYRGYIETHKKFKHMIGKQRFGMLGMFQLPLNILAPLILLTAFSVMAYNISKGIYYFLFRIIFVDGYISSLLSSMPTLKQMLLTMHIDILFPVVLTALVGITMAIIAFGFVDDKLKNPVPALIYLFVFPVMTMLQWVQAILHEIRGAKKQW